MEYKFGLFVKIATLLLGNFGKVPITKCYDDLVVSSLEKMGLNFNVEAIY